MRSYLCRDHYKDGERVEEKLVLGNGRLRLNQNTIGTENPQSFEGLYRCESGGETSALVALFGKIIQCNFISKPQTRGKHA